MGQSKNYHSPLHYCIHFVVVNWAGDMGFPSKFLCYRASKTIYPSEKTAHAILERREEKWRALDNGKNTIVEGKFLRHVGKSSAAVFPVNLSH